MIMFVFSCLLAVGERLNSLMKLPDFYSGSSGEHREDAHHCFQNF
jgi:hypothetical protein